MLTPRSEALPPPTLTYEITGSAAFSRIVPLLSSFESVLVTTARTNNNLQPQPPHLLWENAPRKETRQYRDAVKCYSHLPNGIPVLDSKWALARLFDARLFFATPDKEDNKYFMPLETHCFRGLTGFSKFCQRENMLEPVGDSPSSDHVTERSKGNIAACLPDLCRSIPRHCTSSLFPKPPANLWVVKDASSNGAGGVWVVGPENAIEMLDKSSSPLLEDHRYVAQRYAWPPVLYEGRKCHVRVYGLITSDERAFVHNRAFLHVANDPFQLYPSTDSSPVKFEPSVHITNCCANSHDLAKFSGEICADLDADLVFSERHGQTVVPLKPFYPSIAASLGTLAERAMPFLRGGAANNGFEYLGMDFILSYTENGQPIAYLLEVNSPPSQDTATGLDHAEDLHDEVIRDLLTLWVYPKATSGLIPPRAGGWKCVYGGPNDESNVPLIAPSKAVILNKIRWAIFEQKASKADEQLERFTNNERNNVILHSLPSSNQSVLTAYARRQFPFFCVSCRREMLGACCESSPLLNRLSHTRVFFENAGGAQVPKQVIHAMTQSLVFRDRVSVGSRSKAQARHTLATMMGVSLDEYAVILGSNASTLFATLASEYVRLGFIGPSDEVIISAENHLALSAPWVRAAKSVGAKVKWWMPRKCVNLPTQATCSHDLDCLLTSRTRVVALTHASNILGQVRDLAAVSRLVKKRTAGYGHVIADGVAAAPHIFPNVSELGVDWYGMSCHKLFGPHLGVLCSQFSTLDELKQHDVSRTDLEDPNTILKELEIGTINYEACEGVVGLGQYLRDLASLEIENVHVKDVPADQFIMEGLEKIRSSGSDQPAGDSLGSASPCQCNSVQQSRYLDDISSFEIVEAYRRIRSMEVILLDVLLGGLQRSSKVRIIESSDLDCLERLPVISFLHQDIPCSIVVQTCLEAGVACRHGTFLACQPLAQAFGFDGAEGVVRLSLVHYNTVAEVNYLLASLESIPGWY